MPVAPAVLPTATGQVVADPVPTDTMDQRCPPTEPSAGPDCDREVLLAANTDALHTWQRDRPLGLFAGVRVDPFSGRVVKIEDAWLIPLAGSIPPQLGQLVHLRELDLSHNLLTGSIPSSLNSLLQVRELNLTGITPQVPERFNQPVTGVYTDQAAHWGDSTVSCARDGR